MSQSDVTKIKRQIDLENESAQNACNGLAVVASHAMITAKMERMSNHITALMQAGLHEQAKAVLESDDLWNRPENSER